MSLGHNWVDSSSHTHMRFAAEIGNNILNPKFNNRNGTLWRINLAHHSYFCFKQ